MNVSSVASAAVYSPYPQTSSSSSFVSYFQQLGQDLRAGNVPAAQQAYTSLSQLPQVQNSQNVSLTQGLNQIGNELQAGNLSGAQQTYSSLQHQQAQSLPAEQASGGHHSRHGHGGHGGSGAIPSNSTSTSGSGGSINITV